jgi:hypothetical protein
MDIMDGMIFSQQMDFCSANSGHQTEVPVYFYTVCIDKKTKYLIQYQSWRIK